MTLREKLMHYTNDLGSVDLKQEAIATIEHIAQYVDEDELLHHSRPLALAYLALTEDASVPVVTRCKDCEHAERYERADGTAGYYCGHPQNTFTYGERWDRVFKPAKEADDFCSYGERKDGKDD